MNMATVISASLVVIVACLTVQLAAANDVRTVDDFVLRELSQVRLEIERLKIENEKQNSELAQLRREKQTSRIGSSTTYVRWGRTTCKGDAKVLYKGYVAGARWNMQGSGANLLCLHEKAQYGRYMSGRQSNMNLVFGVEYQVFDSGVHQNNIFSYANNMGRPILDHPAPCAVCHVQTRSTSVMIPARTTCPAGWTHEYNGYVMSERYDTHYRSTFNCWDQAPETAAGGYNQNGGTVIPTEIGCGSLPCGKYVDGLELTCVVCTK